jgi:hypothetical protein
MLKKIIGRIILCLIIIFFVRRYIPNEQVTGASLDNMNQNIIAKEDTFSPNTDTTKYYDECELLKLLPDGSIVIKLNDLEKTVKIFGVELNDSIQPMYTQIITYLFKPIKPCKYIIKSKKTGDELFVKIIYFGWQDKSGDVWIDLAETLLSKGLVKVSAGKFDEKEEYLRHEHEARKKGVGIWKKNKKRHIE